MPLSSRAPARRAGRLAPALLAAAALPLVACGEDAVTPGAAPSPAPATALTVVWDPGEGGEGAEVATWTLRCDPPRGDHPDPDGACADLAALPEPFAAPPEGQVCTEVYGGPQTARVTGTWRGEEVSADLDRTDGCGIARWDDLGRLLPPVAGTGGLDGDGSGAGE